MARLLGCAAGWLCLAAMLALASPGVRIAPDGGVQRPSEASGFAPRDDGIGEAAPTVAPATRPGAAAAPEPSAGVLTGGARPA